MMAADPEDLALLQIAWLGRAVESDEWPGSDARGVVEKAGQELFASAGLAATEALR